ncbi:MAG: zf-HC2 domain-containing protein, partial [Planctomycetes bacterium]|nr:zf-HC2 domain-containing protein [Planctomycetota bacterium]
MSPGYREACRRAHALTSAFLDGRLDAARRAALQRHLQRCPVCLQNLRQTE